MSRYVLILASAIAAISAAFGQEIPVIIPPEKPIPIIELPPFKPSNVAKFDGTKASNSVPWDLQQIKAPEAWAKNPAAKGDDIIIAILDTGCQVNHPGLHGKVIATYNAITKTKDVTDKHGHGTWCTGAAHAVAPNAKLIVVKVLGDNGSGAVDQIAHGIDWAVTEGKADVISMSLGGPTADQFQRPAIQRAIAAGVIVVCAAGNDGGPRDTEGYPGRYPESISVAASTKDGKLASFSSWGPNVFTTDPGENVDGLLPNSQQGEMSGTSMACPKAAGKAASWIASNAIPKNASRVSEYRKAVIAASPFKERKNSVGHGLYTLDKITGDANNVPPKPPVPGKPVSIVIELKDLSAEKQAELRAGGATKFRVEFGHETVEAAPNVMGTNKRDYPAAVKAVARGEQITLAIGVPAPTGAYYADRVESLTPGKFESPGVYDCKIENGQPIMRLRGAVARWIAPTPPTPQYTPAPACGPGGCPQPQYVPGFR